MSKLTESAKDFFNAGKKFGKTLFEETQSQFDKHIKLKIDDLTKTKPVEQSTEPKKATPPRRKSVRKHTRRNKNHH